MAGCACGTRSNYYFPKMNHGKENKLADAIFWGGGFITVGVMLLLNSFGVVNWDFWQFLGKFWPVLLIALGINIILGSTRLGSLLAGLLGLGLFWLTIILSLVLPGQSLGIGFDLGDIFEGVTAQETVEFRILKSEFPMAQDRSLKLHLDSGSMELSDSVGESVLFEGKSEFPKGAEPQISSELKSETVFIEFEPGSQVGMIFGQRVHRLELGASDLVTNLDLQVDSGNADIAFDKLALEDFDVQVSSGSLELDLSEDSLPAGIMQIGLSSGSVSVALPNSVGLKVSYRVNSGLTSIRGDDVRGKGVYTSDNYLSASKKLQFSIEVSSGSFEVR